MRRETILIVDDHPVVIEAVGQAISSMRNFDIISASSASEMKNLLESDKCAERNVRLIFLDIKLPDANGIDLIPALLSRYSIPIIAMSGGDDEEFILNACIKNGAAGFVQKSANLATFSSALRIVMEGGLFFPAKYVGGKKLAPINNVIANLNDRQRQILDLLLAGRSNKQIGDEIFLSEGTVKNRVSELLLLFNVKSRSQIIIEAARHGYNPSRQK